MGLETDFILSDERHYASFECAICQHVVDLDALVTVACSHCFCRPCLIQWLERVDKTGYPVVPNCPTCNRDLSYMSKSSSMMIGKQAVTVQPLQTYQPLAFRLLKRVHVRCPLKGVGCHWNGDYGDLQAHLISQTAHTTATTNAVGDATMNDTPTSGISVCSPAEETPSNNKRKLSVAVSFKEQANDRFSSGHYGEACDLYSTALSNLPITTATLTGNINKEEAHLAAALYSNRAAAQLALKNYPAAGEDASQAIRLDATYIKAYVRHARALVQMGSFRTALQILQDGLVVQPTAPVLLKELEAVVQLDAHMQHALTHLQNSEYATAKSVFGQLLRQTNSESVLLGAARADLGLGLTTSTLRLTIQVLKLNPQSADGYLVRGQCLVLMGEMDAGIKLLKESMRLDPDAIATRTILRECRKVQTLLQEGREMVFRREFEGAVDRFGSAMNACGLLPPKSPLYGTLHTERAQTHMRLKQYDAALKDCALVLYSLDDDVPAWLIKFQALHGLNRHQEALDEASDLMQKWGSSDDRIRKAYDKADFEVRKSNRPDFYTMLGIPSIASEREIKKAYRQAALDMHPDRFSSNQYTEERRKQAIQEFHLLGEGLEMLTDDFKRQLYDEGYDLEAIKERVEAAQRAAHMRPDHYHGRQ